MNKQVFKKYEFKNFTKRHFCLVLCFKSILLLYYYYRRRRFYFYFMIFHFHSKFTIIFIFVQLLPNNNLHGWCYFLTIVIAMKKPTWRDLQLDLSNKFQLHKRIFYIFACFMLFFFFKDKYFYLSVLAKDSQEHPSSFYGA